MIASFGEDIYNELYIDEYLRAIYKIQKGKQLKDLGIEIINLHKKYDDVYAVKGIDLSIKKGEFYGLLGPNGAGKSTTINAITSLVKPTDGEVKILGKNIVSDFRYARSQIGIACQELSNDFFFPVEELLYYQAGYYGVTRKNS